MRRADGAENWFASAAAIGAALASARAIPTIEMLAIGDGEPRNRDAARHRTATVAASLERDPTGACLRRSG
jgi:hypothetical protein